MRSESPDLRFPREAPPPPGEAAEIAPGVLWLRLALPYRLDHVNAYLLEDHGGWAVLDTGLDDSPTRAAWERLLGGRLAGQRVTRIIVTHYHPDHVGLAGWLAERFCAPLYMTLTEFLLSEFVRSVRGLSDDAHSRAFYAARGLGREATEAVLGRGQEYLRRTVALPASFRRLRAGETLDVGGRRLEVLTGGGHSPDMAMLLARADGLFFAADQVLARISPNVSVVPVEPEADPLADYLASLDALAAAVPEGSLVLAAHNLPFFGLHQRVAELRAHHEQRCAVIVSACRAAPCTVADLIPVLFRRTLNPHQTGFAFGEALAHATFLTRRGRLRERVGADEVRRYVAETAEEREEPPHP